MRSNVIMNDVLGRMQKEVVMTK